MSGNVKVCCRFRPQLPNELAKGGAPICHFDSTGTAVAISGTRKAQFKFDRVFEPESTQGDVYDYAAKPIVEDVLKGYNGTIFAYGQTSSGKTHTMEGRSVVDPAERGIIPRIVHNIFGYIDLAPETLEFTVKVSYFEIYMERVRDLLADGKDNLQIHENRERGVYVRHATELYMQDPEDVMDVMSAGAERRSVATTNMNDHSSRSHSVFLMEISQKDTVKGGMKTGKLFLVDLAGSEKVSKTGADGEVLEEAKNINKSLSALGLVIMSLTDEAHTHVPYRDSKLTRILQESLGGNARTTIIICCSPSSYNEQETISTLRFGQRAKKIKNKAVINVQYSAEELEKQLAIAKRDLTKLAKKLEAAERELEVWRSGGTVSEEDRVKLKMDEAVVADDAAAATKAAPAAAPAEPGLSEEEKSEFLARETELLDLLDDKDEHIRELESEIEGLSTDKVAMTQLAADNARLRAELDEKEQIEQELLQDNDEYEEAIERLASLNGELTADIEKSKAKVKETEIAAEQQLKTFEDRLALVADYVNTLVEVDPTTQFESNTVVDTALSKAHATLLERQMIQQEKEKELAEYESKLNASVAAVEEAQLALGSAQFSLAKAEERAAKSSAQCEELESRVQELSEKDVKSQSQIEDLMAQVLAAQGQVDAKQDEAAEAARVALDKQREAQREEHQKQVASLRQQLDTLKQQADEKSEENDVLSRKVQELETQIVQLTKRHEEQVAKLTEVQEKSAKLVAEDRKKAVVERNTKQCIQTYQATATARRGTLLDSFRATLANIKGTSASTAVPSSGASAAGETKVDAKTKFLEDEIRNLRTETKKSQKELHAVRRELIRASKEKEAMQERLKNTEKLLRESYAKYEQLDLRQAGQRRAVQRQARGGGQRKMPVRGGGGSYRRKGQTAEDSTATKFWDSQAGPTRQSTRRSIAGQGEPMVGQYARPKVDMEAELEKVDYV
eukprot:m.12185 g.12185  ORF g.12185 m.12185 type:complete len:965 (+) comp5809_c0_seq1:393-3287(+)